MYACQQNLIKLSPELKTILEFICSESHKLTNCGIYYARQLFFKTGKLIGKFDLEKEYKTNQHYQVLYSQAAQQILRSVAEAFKSFKELDKKSKKGELANKPKLPRYRKGYGYALVTYPKQALKLVENNIRIPLGNTVKRWFGLDSFLLPMPTNLNFNQLRELRILPRNLAFYAEFVYQKEVVISDNLNPNNVLGIDPGLNNWLSCISNVGTGFIVDGRKLKSLNQNYNKRVGKLKNGKPQGFWNEELARIAEKRNRQVRDAINKAARIVINHCLDYQISKVVFGWNKGNKNGIEIGKKNNQEFVQVPTARLKERIKQLCEQYGIRFIETEESYTSKASYLDNDILPKFGDEASKPKGWKPSGKRVKRGLYKTKNGIYLNADLNGAANIIRKVETQLNLNLAEVCRALLTVPLRVFLWDSKKIKRSRTVLTSGGASI